MRAVAATSGGGWEDVVALVTARHPHRHLRLFQEFLPEGYRLTSLSPLAGAAAEAALKAKVLLGTLITFEDDLADHPRYFDPAALATLSGQADAAPLDGRSAQNLHLARLIEAQLWATLAGLPHAATYTPLLRFDLDQFRAANRYSALQRLYPGLVNLAESRHFGAFNMGMVAAGTVDLMVLGALPPAALGAVRQATFLGQRAARLSNVMTTWARERQEGDLSNEALIAAATGEAELHAYLDEREVERRQLLGRIARLGSRGGVDLAAYAGGVEAFHRLHLTFLGTI